MVWCEKEGVDYVLGLAKNDRLKKWIVPEMEVVRQLQQAMGKAMRQFQELRYQTRKSWTCERRVVAKVEHLPGRENPRFIVTSVPLDECDGRTLYEEVYCARGDMENRIIGSVCGPDLVETDRGQSTEFVFFGVCIPDGAHVAVGGAGRDEAGAGAELDPATETAEDRGSGPGHHPQGRCPFPRATRMRRC